MGPMINLTKRELNTLLFLVMGASICMGAILGVILSAMILVLA